MRNSFPYLSFFSKSQEKKLSFALLLNLDTSSLACLLIEKNRTFCKMGISILPILIDKSLFRQVASEDFSGHCGVAVPWQQARPPKHWESCHGGMGTAITHI